MPLTRSFKETVREMIKDDPDFADILFEEAVQAMIAGDWQTGKSVLRDYINATVGFEDVSQETGTPAEGLVQMLGPDGSLQAEDLFVIMAFLERRAGLQLKVSIVKEPQLG